MREVRLFVDQEREKHEGVIEIRVFDFPDRDENLNFRRVKVFFGDSIFLFTFRYGTYILGGIGRASKQRSDDEYEYYRDSQAEIDFTKKILEIVDKTFAYPISPPPKKSPDLSLW